MKLKLLTSVALAASFALSATADVSEKQVPVPDLDPKIEAKEIASVDELKDLFTGTVKEGDHVVELKNYEQQARIGQDGRRNSADIDQTLSVQGLAQIRQDGNGNTASATQADVAPNVAFNNPRNLAVIDQVENNNTAYSDQTHTGRGRTNVVEIHQASERGNVTGNYADAFQKGVDNSSLINQDGLSNAAYSTQFGASQTSVIDQSGSLNYADVYQHTGSENDSTVIQVGYGGYQNAAYVEQVGSWNASVVQQEGDGNYAEVFQPGDDNKSFVSQYGADNSADVDQYGDFNEAILQQNGNDNSATVLQETDFNLAFIDQSGNGNTATATQVYSDYNQSLIVQTGFNNTAATYQ